ncbi:MAG: hypothetical protein AABO41_24025 [Acidobacteriota bacterium]
MRNCPVCGESFGDELNFCDVDGAQLNRDPADVAQAKNKLWSILGVVLLVGALAISALSVIFIPRGRVPSPAIVNSQPAAAPEDKLATAETPANAQPSSPNSEPEALLPADAAAPEAKKREPLPEHENGNLSKSAKAAAKEAEATENPAPEPQPAPAPVAPKKPETPSVKPVSERSESEPPSASASTSTDSKAAGSKSAGNSNSKKKDDDKDKKKGGFFKVFKKIFGKN